MAAKKMSKKTTISVTLWTPQYEALIAGAKHDGLTLARYIREVVAVNAAKAAGLDAAALEALPTIDARLPAQRTPVVAPARLRRHSDVVPRATDADAALDSVLGNARMVDALARSVVRHGASDVLVDALAKWELAMKVAAVAQSA